MSSTASLSAVIVGLAVLALVVGTSVATRRGYRFGRNVVVRCADGHLFTTIWIPGVSFKSLRLGFRRFQRCPVAGHWTLVAPVRDEDLSEHERYLAGRFRDGPIP